MVFTRQGLCGLGLFALCLLRATNASFYECPEGCAAMFLPRDMMMIDDCLCDDGVDTTAEEAAADAIDEVEFACTGRYKPKNRDAKSFIDCDCYHPYEKDLKTQECVLTSCPRAGNYEPKPGVSRVESLADCTCATPYVKVDKSGQCVLKGGGKTTTKYECPPNSTPTPESVPQSFHDCHCSWGFVRNGQQCEREHAAYVCPINSVKRGERPQGFFDCDCVSTEYIRDEEAHACWPAAEIKKTRKAKRKRSNSRTEDTNFEKTTFECPSFSRAVATVPHSVEQCRCIPGYAWKLPEMTCVRTSAYTCPEHSYKRTKLEAVLESSFDDCTCARGYFLDAAGERCLPWMLANSNSCPPFAVLSQWPLQSSANCKCIYGLNETQSDTQDKADEVPVLNRKECNTKPVGHSSPEFSQCPPNSIATTWPIKSADDCTCLYSFEMTPLSAQEVSRGVGDGFHCVATPETNVLADEAAAACRAPDLYQAISGKCRLPVEEVVKKKVSEKKTNGKPEGVLFKGIEYDYELVDDSVMVIQGDIAIGERFVWEHVDPDDHEEVTRRIEHVLHGYYNSGRDHRWPRYQFCFQIDQSARLFQRTLLSAMQHITHASGFKFHHCEGENCRTDLTCASHDFVVVQGVASSCYSFVGRIGGPQRLGVSVDCGLGNVVHVLLHAIGLRHTIDRADRDEHVRIAWECIPESKRSYFVVEDSQASSHVDNAPPYDLFSIMHHPIDAFVHSVQDEIKPQWCPSVVPLIADDAERLTVMKKMGQRERMTTSDVKSIWALYPELKKHYERQKASSSGGVKAEELHDSFLHTEEDAVQTESTTGSGSVSHTFGHRLVSFMGALVTLVGFGALLGFVSIEVRRRVMLSSSDDYFYEAPLIDSKNDI